MAIENTYLLGKNITLGCGFDLQAKAPLDSRQTVPSFEGLRALIIGDAAYEGMIVYDEGTKKTYQAQKCESYSVEVDGKTKTYDIAFREFGINESELKELIASETTAAMEFKGATAALPENPAKGDMWKVTASFEVAGETTKVGDSIVYNGEEWFRIPSGDDIEDTWRIVKVEGTSLGGISEGKELNLTAGDKLDVTINTDGAVVYSHEAIDAPELLAENEQTRTYITAVETDGYGHITGYKTATENVGDSNTTYEFEGLPVGEDEAAPSSVYFQVASKEKGAEAGTPEVIYLDAYSKNEADAKFVESVSIASSEEGKVQLTVDGTAQTAVEINGFADLVAKKHEHSFVETELNKIAYGDVAKWNTAAGKADDNAQAIEDLEDYVGTIPNTYTETNVIDYINKKAQETLAAASGNSTETAASVKQQLDDYIGSNNTRVETAEGKITDLETEAAKHALKADVEAEFAKYTTATDQKAIDDEQDRRLTALEGDSATHATKDELNAVDKKFEDYTKTADLPTDLGDFTNNAGYAKTADLGNLAALDTITADKVTDFATEVAKVKVNEAVKADEATKAAQDGNGKVIADTYAEKATTLAGYGIGDAYTKTEIEALLTWGSF